MSRNFKKFAIVCAVEIILQAAASQLSSNGIHVTRIEYKSCDQQDLEFELQKNDYNYQDSTIVKCDSVKVKGKVTKSLDCGVGCQPGYTMEQDQPKNQTFQEVFSLKCRNLLVKSDKGESLYTWLKEDGTIAFKTTTQKALPSCKLATCPTGVSLRVNHGERKRMLKWRDNHTTLKLQLSKKFIKQALMKRFLIDKKNLENSKIVSSIASNYKKNGWTIMFEFDQPLNASLFRSVATVKGRHFQILNGSRNIAFSSYKNDKDLLGGNNDTSNVYNIEMKFNSYKGDASRDFYGQRPININVKEVRLFDHSYKNLSCLFNENIDTPVKIQDFEKENWEVGSYLNTLKDGPIFRRFCLFFGLAGCAGF